MLMSMIGYSTSAFLIWDNLRERFNKTNESRIVQLHKEMYLVQQDVNQILFYFTKLRMLWEDLFAIICLLWCGCDLFKKHIEHSNNLNLFRFLKALNESYYTIGSNLVMS